VPTDSEPIVADEVVEVTETRPQTKTVLGSNEPSQAVRPRFIVEINDEAWPEIRTVTLSLSGFNLNSNLNVDAVYSLIGETNETGTISPKSRLAKLLEPTLEVKRNVIKLYAGYVEKDEFTKEDLDLAFVGAIVRLKIDLADNCVTIIAEDQAIILRETFTHAQYRNQTTAGVVREIVEQFGFEAEIVDTSQPVGVVYDRERISWEANSTSTQGQNNWDIIQKMASYDSFKAFFDKGKFYYIPIEDFDQNIEFILGVNVVSIIMEKNYSINQSRINVEIASSNLKAKDNVLATTGRGVSTDTSGESVVHRMVLPGLDPDTASMVASTMGLALAQLEKLVQVETTGYILQTPRNVMTISNTGTEFDFDKYRIIHVEWMMGVDSGWQATLTGLCLPNQGELRVNRKTHGQRYTSRR
jgi:hypothetical protein